MPTINDETVELVKRWEGLRLQAYKDIAGVWTIGYGHTTGVRPGDKITEETAETYLRQDLATASKAVADLVKVPLADNQFGALSSFVFNLGRGNFEGSTLLKKLNARQYDAVPEELMKWVKARNPKTGKKEDSPGLVNRRAAEVGLWAKGAFVAGNAVDAAKVSEPPSTPAAAAGGGAIGVGVVGAAAAMTPFAGFFENLANGAPYLVGGVIAVLLIGAGIWLLRRK
jgi:lysozyme